MEAYGEDYRGGNTAYGADNFDGHLWRSGAVGASNAITYDDYSPSTWWGHTLAAGLDNVQGQGKRRRNPGGIENNVYVVAVAQRLNRRGDIFSVRAERQGRAGRFCCFQPAGVSGNADHNQRAAARLLCRDRMLLQALPDIF